MGTLIRTKEIIKTRFSVQKAKQVSPSKFALFGTGRKDENDYILFDLFGPTGFEWENPEKIELKGVLNYPTSLDVFYSKTSVKIAADLERPERRIVIKDVSKQKDVYIYPFHKAAHFGFLNRGQLLAVQDHNSVSIYDASAGSLVKFLPANNATTISTDGHSPYVCILSFRDLGQNLDIYDASKDVLFTSCPARRLDNVLLRSRNIFVSVDYEAYGYFIKPRIPKVEKSDCTKLYRFKAKRVGRSSLTIRRYFYDFCFSKNKTFVLYSDTISFSTYCSPHLVYEGTFFIPDDFITGFFDIKNNILLICKNEIYVLEKIAIKEKTK